jgi:hypothetical protein
MGSILNSGICNHAYSWNFHVVFWKLWVHQLNHFTLHGCLESLIKHVEPYLNLLSDIAFHLHSTHALELHISDQVSIHKILGTGHQSALGSSSLIKYFQDDWIAGGQFNFGGQLYLRLTRQIMVGIVQVSHPPLIFMHGQNSERLV